MRNKKLQVWLPLLLAVVMIAGMFFGFTLHQQTGARDFFAGNKTSALQEAMDLIKARYVDSVQLDSLKDDAINAVMDHLDPHSVIYRHRVFRKPPKNCRELLKASVLSSIFLKTPSTSFTSFLTGQAKKPAFRSAIKSLR